MLLKPFHPFCNKDGYDFKHRFIMEKHLGRYLTKKEVVHHINGIECDNRPENLMIFACNGDHMTHHAAQRRGRKFMSREVEK